MCTLVTYRALRLYCKCQKLQYKVGGLSNEQNRKYNDISSNIFQFPLKAFKLWSEHLWMFPENLHLFQRIWDRQSSMTSFVELKSHCPKFRVRNSSSFFGLPVFFSFLLLWANLLQRIAQSANRICINVQEKETVLLWFPLTFCCYKAELRMNKWPNSQNEHISQKLWKWELRVRKL